jgi:hypothetical protein
VEADSALSAMKTSWKQFVPRTPAADEVAPVGGTLPSTTYQQASGILCRTALDLLNQPNPSKPGWGWALKNASSEVLSRYPDGKKLVVYNDFNDIYENLHSNCYCKATGELAVLYTKERYCG